MPRDGALAHRMRQRGAVAATAVDKVSLLFASSAVYAASVAWYGTIEVGRGNAPLGQSARDTGKAAPVWLIAVAVGTGVCGVFSLALRIYGARCAAVQLTQGEWLLPDVMEPGEELDCDASAAGGLL